MSLPDSEEHFCRHCGQAQDTDSDSEALIEAAIAILQKKLNRKRQEKVAQIMRTKRLSMSVDDLPPDDSTNSRKRPKLNHSMRKVETFKYVAKRPKINHNIPTVRGPNPFLDLPRELHDMIYVTVFEDLPTSIILRSQDLPGEHSNLSQLMPGLFHVNQQLYAECTAILFRKKNVVVDDTRNLKILNSFLDRIPDQEGCKAVTSLYLADWAHWNTFGETSRLPLYTSSLRFLAPCIGLKNLTMHVKLNNVAKTTQIRREGKRCGYTRRKSRKEVADWFGSVIFELPVLRSLTLKCVGRVYSTADYIDEFDSAEEYFAVLVNHVKKGLQKKNRDVDVQVRYLEWGHAEDSVEYFGWGPS